MYCTNIYCSWYQLAFAVSQTTTEPQWHLLGLTDLGGAPLGDSAGLSWAHLGVYTFTGDSAVGWGWLRDLSSASWVSQPPSGSSGFPREYAAPGRGRSTRGSKVSCTHASQDSLWHLQTSCSRQTPKMVLSEPHLWALVSQVIPSPEYGQDL